MIQLLLEESAAFGPWVVTNKGDIACRTLADKHYSRQTVGASQFCRPGKNLVLRTAAGDAAIVFWSGIRDDGLEAYEITLFRNESQFLSSDLIKWGLAAVTKLWGHPPTDQIITYVNPDRIQSHNPGYCFKKAGFYIAGTSKRGLLRMRIDKHVRLLNIYEIEGIQKYWNTKEAALKAFEERKYIKTILLIKQLMSTERNLKRIQSKLTGMGYNCCTSFMPIITDEALESAGISI
ncbi:hypothetical protein [Brevibacillus choshinensis]|uniref:hypothetical protein n=1 Tax=Brevibacillus choshinensis TaxID=54911 RepID=UPI002E1ED3E1|nr:hypothetical protein [Brevibacillus choshinensis]